MGELIKRILQHYSRELNRLRDWPEFYLIENTGCDAKLNSKCLPNVTIQRFLAPFYVVWKNINCYMIYFICLQYLGVDNRMQEAL